MEGCNVVIHLAAQSSVTAAEHNPALAHEVNATGTFNVLRTASELGVHRVIVASSREVYGEVDDLPVPESAPPNPKNIYGASKAAAEMYCWWTGVHTEVTVLRLANVFGPGDR